MAANRFVPALSHPRLSLKHQGKTRDTFAIKDATGREATDRLLVVATCRLSTHNIVHLSEVPFKDEVLTALTVFWVQELLEPIGIEHHMLGYGSDIYSFLGAGTRSTYPEDLHHRAIVVRKLEMIPVEFIYRNYLCGSLYKKYLSKGLPDPYGLDLPVDTPLMHRFHPPIFTPTDKSETDEPLDAPTTLGNHQKAWLATNRTFTMAAGALNRCGLELVDSKFEVGVDEYGVVRVADEIVTPDSSRFARLGDIQVGAEPPWLDKQLARDAAEKLWGDKPQAPLAFDPNVLQGVSMAYLDVFETITGQSLGEFQKTVLD